MQLFMTKQLHEIYKTLRKLKVTHCCEPVKGSVCSLRPTREEHRTVLCI